MNSLNATLRFIFGHYRLEWRLSLLVLLGVGIGIGGNFMTFYGVKEIVDGIVTAQELGEVPHLWGLFSTFIAGLIVNLIGWRIGIASIIMLQPKLMRASLEDAFVSIHQHSFNFFNNEFVGSLVKKANRMTTSSEDFSDIVLLELYPMLLRIFIAIVFLFTLSIPMGVIILLWSIIYFGGNLLAARYKARHYDGPENDADTKLTGFIADSISNALNVKLFSNFRHEKKRFRKRSSWWMDRIRDSWWFNEYVEASQNVAMIVLHVGLLMFAIQLWSQGQITIGEFVLVSSYLAETMVFIWDFGRSTVRLNRTISDMQEMVEIMEKPIGVKDKAGAKRLKVKKGQISIQDLSFSYGKDIANQESIFNDFTMEIPSGQHLALIGPSGGGKTTLIKLLLRLFDIQDGKILIDGQDIAGVTQESLRQEIALVPQDPILFHRSLMENIRYGRLDATDKEVIRASKLAHCHEFVQRFKKGYDTMVGERGVKLSGGERQRIAIARAILSRAKILILDEATSNLDVHSEELISDAIAKLIDKKTAMVIAHRLSTVTHMDRILVLENGEIVEEGTHKQLLNKKGLYAKFWQLSQQGIS